MNGEKFNLEKGHVWTHASVVPSVEVMPLEPLPWNTVWSQPLISGNIQWQHRWQTKIFHRQSHRKMALTCTKPLPKALWGLLSASDWMEKAGQQLLIYGFGKTFAPRMWGLWVHVKTRSGEENAESQVTSFQSMPNPAWTPNPAFHMHMVRKSYMPVSCFAWFCGDFFKTTISRNGSKG